MRVGVSHKAREFSCIEGGGGGEECSAPELGGRVSAGARDDVHAPRF